MANNLIADFTVFKQLEIGRIASSTQIVSPANVVNQCHAREQLINFNDVAAGTAVAETPAAIAPYKANLQTANVVSPATFAASTTNYAVVTLFARTGAAAARAIAIGNLYNVAVTGFVPVAMAQQTANLPVLAGDLITFSVAKTGTGEYLANGALAGVELVLEDV